MHNHAPADYQCPFCAISRDDFHDGTESRKDDVFYHDDLITAFISSRYWPNIQGNVVIVPNEHYENLYELPDKYLDHIGRLSQRVAVAMKEAFGCDATSVRQHNEPAGNQDVWHYHFQVFPRYAGDDLYVNHLEKKPSDPDVRKEHADKLRESLNKLLEAKPL